MRTIERTTVFKGDYKRLRKGPLRNTLESELRPIVKLLVQDEPLPANCRDHVLTGDWKG